MNGRAGIAAVAVVGAVALARFAPEAVRIDREAREGFGRLAVAALVVALAACAVHAWRRGLEGAIPALPLLLAALPFVLHHTKAVLPDYAKLDPLTLHIAFKADDVAQQRQRLLAAGATLAGDIVTTETGDLMTFVRDPWSVTIQLVKRATPLAV